MSSKEAHRIIRIPAQAARLMDRLNQRGFSAHVVGGCVRDSLLGRRPQDWDIATSARPEQVLDCFSEYRTVPTGLKHGTVTVLAGEEPYEITTYRVDGAYSDHRRPDQVTFTGELREDLSRRDFTVNAMAYHPDTGLVDYFGGREHLEQRRIACVGEPDLRFREDALRILRAARFASVLGFSIQEETRRSMHRSRGLLAAVSAERIAAELNKALLGEGFRAVFTENAPILFQILPELEPAFGFEQHNPHHHLDVFSHILAAVQSAPPILPVKLALLFHDIEKPSHFTRDETGKGHFYGHPKGSAETAKRVMTRLRYDNETIRRVEQLVYFHDTHIEPAPNTVRRWLNRLGEETLRQLLLVKRADNAAKAPGKPSKRSQAVPLVEALLEEVIAREQCFQLKDLAVDGNDLLALGIPAGPRVGEILRKLLNRVMDEVLPNEKAALLRVAREWYPGTPGEPGTEPNKR